MSIKLTLDKEKNLNEDNLRTVLNGKYPNENINETIELIKNYHNKSTDKLKSLRDLTKYIGMSSSISDLNAKLANPTAQKYLSYKQKYLKLKNIDISDANINEISNLSLDTINHKYLKYKQKYQLNK